MHQVAVRIDSETLRRIGQFSHDPGLELSCCRRRNDGEKQCAADQTEQDFQTFWLAPRSDHIISSLSPRFRLDLTFQSTDNVLEFRSRGGHIQRLDAPQFAGVR